MGFKLFKTFMEKNTQYPEQVILLQETRQHKVALGFFCWILAFMLIDFLCFNPDVASFVVFVMFLTSPFLLALAEDVLCLRLSEQRWHLDFALSVIVGKRSDGITTIIPFSNVAEVYVRTNSLLGTKSIVLFLDDDEAASDTKATAYKGRKKMGVAELGPLSTIPQGLDSRLEKACQACRAKVEAESFKSILPDDDTSLETVLSELKAMYEQKSGFWKKEEWFPKSQATAYYRMENGTLWEIICVKREHMEPEWILHRNGKISASNWKLLIS